LSSAAGLNVLYEDNHLLAVEKPARLLVAPDETGDESLLDRARDYLRRVGNKPGNVYVGLVHRIDRPVSGVVLFARTSKAASRLSDQFRTGSVQKQYIAAVRGIVPASADLVDWLLKDTETNLVRSVARGHAGAKESQLTFRRRKQIGHVALLEVEPVTGRSHQIRVQLATAGFPIEGDVKYGGTAGWEGAIALHAWKLTIQHPTQQQPIVITCPLPAEWGQHGVAGID
jgi:23S rRNA pseudouridine1911/1915/1917 synthase